MMSPGLTLTTCAPSPDPESILYKRTEFVLSCVVLGISRVGSVLILDFQYSNLDGLEISSEKMCAGYSTYRVF